MARHISAWWVPDGGLGGAVPLASATPCPGSGVAEVFCIQPDSTAHCVQVLTVDETLGANGSDFSPGVPAPDLAGHLSQARG